MVNLLQRYITINATSYYKEFDNKCEHMIGNIIRVLYDQRIAMEYFKILASCNYYSLC